MSQRDISSEIIDHRNTTLNYELRTQNQRRRRFGFTLVEFLVVLGILSITVVSTLLFLTSILKGTNQANVTSEVKQNGQFVLDSLDRQVRNSVDSQGRTLISGNTYKELKLLRETEDPLYLKCNYSVAGTSNGYISSLVSENDPPTGSYTSITNTDTTVGVNIVNCQFTVLSAKVSASGTAVPAVVTVEFTAQQAVLASTRQDFVASAPFRTTISLRQYGF